MSHGLHQHMEFEMDLWIFVDKIRIVEHLNDH